MPLLTDEVLVDLSGQLVDHASEVGVLDEEPIHLLVVAVGLGLLECPCRFCPIMTNVDRKIASSETMSVSVGHGLLSSTSIQHAKNAA